MTRNWRPGSKKSVSTQRVDWLWSSISSKWCLSPSCLRSGGEVGLRWFLVGLLLARAWKVGRWHDNDDFDRSLPPRWTPRVPRQHCPRWVVRPKSVFSDGRDLVDRDVNCRPLDWKYDNFPVQEMAPPRNLGRSHLKSDSWFLQLQRLWDQFARQTCCTFIPATSQNKTAHFYKRQLKTWFRAGRRPWSLLVVRWKNLRHRNEDIAQFSGSMTHYRTIYQMFDSVSFMVQALRRRVFK